MKKVFFIAVLVCLLAVVVGIMVLPYRPPLLKPEGRNPREWLFDHILFAWHYTRSGWFEGMEGGDAGQKTRALAAWYHPALLEPIFSISPSDYYHLAGLYESLGLTARAAQLFEFDFELGESTLDRARQAILSCAGLGAWKEVERIADRSASPDFPEGYYWRGRGLMKLGHEAEGLSALRRAADLLPEDADLQFRMGEASENMGDTAAAETYFRQAVKLSPLHQAAWNNLSGLYRIPGQKNEVNPAATRADDLLPPLRARARFGNEIILLGSSLIPPVIHGEDEFGLTLYYRSLPGRDREIRPLIRLRSTRSGKSVLLAPIPLPGSPGEEYLVAPIKIRVPRDIWPGETELSIGFLDPEGEPLRIFGERGYELPLATATVRPRLFRNDSEYRLPPDISAGGVIDLGLETVLAGISGVTVQPDSEVKVLGLGLVSSTRDTVPLPDGTEVARVECRGDDGSLYKFPVRLGIETADRCLDQWSSNITGHLPAEISSSRILKEKSGREFSAHSYRTIFRFPRPIRLAEIRLNYDYPARGAWRVKHIFLLKE